MATDRMNQLVVMVNLCSSVIEGIEHLMAYQGNERLKNDAVTGLLTLEENLREMQASKTVVRETRWMAEVVKNRLFVYDREFKNRLYRWYFSALRELRNLMTAELEKCPVCSGKGIPNYGALLYMEGGEEEEDVLEPVRVFMKCQECGNYFLAREESGFLKRRKKKTRTKAECEKILASIREFVSDGVMLFIGEENSQLYKEAIKEGYALKRLSLTDPYESIDKSREKYSVVLIERISLTRDMKVILTHAVESLENGGIIWFDGPDMKKSLRNLEKKGVSMWRGEAAEVCLSNQGMEKLAEECGLCIKSSRRVGTALGRIEIIAQKQSERRNIYGASDNA